MPIFFSCSSLVVFFFVFAQTLTIHTLLALQKSIFLALGQKRKKINSNAFIYRIRCLISFSCSSLVVFFFVLTPKPTIHTLLALQKSIFLALGQKRKKINSDAFISRIRCLYVLFLVLL